jgi:iron complex transport system ATP-binding protein
VSELSDGERQKVMIARALAQEPDILILDEPTAFLDLPRRVDIMRLLRNLAHETRCSVLLSTHDLDLALRSADRIWLLPSGGPLKAGIPEDLVLDGTFEATFQSEGVVFDKNTGSFKIHRSWIGQIGLIGEGLPTFWTARALEREGFEVIRSGNPLPLQVEIMVQNGNIRWRSRCYETHHEHSTLGELVAFMKGFSS